MTRISFWRGWARATTCRSVLKHGHSSSSGSDGRCRITCRSCFIEALRALQAGDRRALKNIAPEIRTTAEIFYDGIVARLKKLPEKTRRRPLPKLKQTRSRRRR